MNSALPMIVLLCAWVVCGIWPMATMDRAVGSKSQFHYALAFAVMGPFAVIPALILAVRVIRLLRRAPEQVKGA